jgi:hypothetical protein
MIGSLERLLNRPVIGWVNAAFYDARIGIPLASTALAYRVGTNDPQECIAAGVVVGLAVVVANLLLYARLDQALETQPLREVIAQHRPRHARIWAETNGQMPGYERLED